MDDRQFANLNEVLLALWGLRSADCSQSRLSGGCINSAVVLENPAFGNATFGRVVYKENIAKERNFFQEEAQGLALLSEFENEGLCVPKVYAVMDKGILMEYLPPARVSANGDGHREPAHVREHAGGQGQRQVMRRFGASLGTLHRESAEKRLRGSTGNNGSAHSNSKVYGLGAENFLGSSKQINSPMDNWVQFFADNRLVAQLDTATRSNALPQSIAKKIDGLIQRLDNYLPPTPPPSLLHGDLWGGNYLITQRRSVQPQRHSQRTRPQGDSPSHQQNSARSSAESPPIHQQNHAKPTNPHSPSPHIAAIIDPAVYYGHFEADLAMTELFGGFDQSFYSGYAEICPIPSDYAIRKQIYNLYHLLNHLNLFGSGYLSSVSACLASIPI